MLPTGEIIRTGGRLWKDVAGYDLTRLLTGSEGTLGVLTEVTVALLPMPATTNTGVALLPDAGRRRAGPSARIIGDGIVPATLEFLDAKCIGAVEEYATWGCATTRARCCCSATTARARRRRPQPRPHRRAVHRRGRDGGDPRREHRPSPRRCWRRGAARCRRCPGWAR